MHLRKSSSHRELFLFPFNTYFIASLIIMAEKPGLLYSVTLFMSLLYAVAGLFLLFSQQAADFLPGWKHYVLGAMLIVYSGIRVIRLRNIRRSLMDEHDKS